MKPNAANDIEVVLLPRTPFSPCGACIFNHTSVNTGEYVKNACGVIKDDWSDCSNTDNEGYYTHGYYLQFHLVHKLTGQVVSPKELVDHYKRKIP